jgi:hypothetical protein
MGGDRREPIALGLFDAGKEIMLIICENSVRQ